MRVCGTCGCGMCVPVGVVYVYRCDCVVCGLGMGMQEAGLLLQMSRAPTASRPRVRVGVACFCLQLCPQRGHTVGRTKATWIMFIQHGPHSGFAGVRAAAASLASCHLVRSSGSQGSSLSLFIQGARLHRLVQQRGRGYTPLLLRQGTLCPDLLCVNIGTSVCCQAPGEQLCLLAPGASNSSLK